MFALLSIRVNNTVFAAFLPCRETFVANAAAAKSELEKVRKLCREEIEERRQDAEAALEKQVT